MSLMNSNQSSTPRQQRRRAATPIRRVGSGYYYRPLHLLLLLATCFFAPTLSLSDSEKKTTPPNFLRWRATQEFGKTNDDFGNYSVSNDFDNSTGIFVEFASFGLQIGPVTSASNNNDAVNTNAGDDMTRIDYANEMAGLKNAIRYHLNATLANLGLVSTGEEYTAGQFGHVQVDDVRFVDFVNDNGEGGSKREGEFVRGLQSQPSSMNVVITGGRAFYLYGAGGLFMTSIPTFGDLQTIVETSVEKKSGGNDDAEGDVGGMLAVTIRELASGNMFQNVSSVEIMAGLTLHPTRSPTTPVPTYPPTKEPTTAEPTKEPSPEPTPSPTPLPTEAVVVTNPTTKQPAPKLTPAELPTTPSPSTQIPTSTTFNPVEISLPEEVPNEVTDNTIGGEASGDEGGDNDNDVSNEGADNAVISEANSNGNPSNLNSNDDNDNDNDTINIILATTISALLVLSASIAFLVHKRRRANKNYDDGNNSDEGFAKGVPMSRLTDEDDHYPDNGGGDTESDFVYNLDNMESGGRFDKVTNKDGGTTNGEGGASSQREDGGIPQFNPDLQAADLGMYQASSKEPGDPVGGTLNDIENGNVNNHAIKNNSKSDTTKQTKAQPLTSRDSLNIHYPMSNNPVTSRDIGDLDVMEEVKEDPSFASHDILSDINAAASERKQSLGSSQKRKSQGIDQHPNLPIDFASKVAIHKEPEEENFDSHDIIRTISQVAAARSSGSTTPSLENDAYISVMKPTRVNVVSPSSTTRKEDPRGDNVTLFSNDTTDLFAELKTLETNVFANFKTVEDVEDATSTYGPPAGCGANFIQQTKELLPKRSSLVCKQGGHRSNTGDDLGGMQSLRGLSGKNKNWKPFSSSGTPQCSSGRFDPDTAIVSDSDDDDDDVDDDDDTEDDDDDDDTEDDDEDDQNDISRPWKQKWNTDPTTVFANNTQTVPAMVLFDDGVDPNGSNFDPDSDWDVDDTEVEFGSNANDVFETSPVVRMREAMEDKKADADDVFETSPVARMREAMNDEKAASLASQRIW